MRDEGGGVRDEGRGGGGEVNAHLIEAATKGR